MCLIAYSSNGRALSNGVIKAGHKNNPDGIGIMSALGVRHFVGAGALKKFRRYLRAEVQERGVPYAVHFRWATHGDVNRENTHPFALPNNSGWLMHNGVIGQCTAPMSKAEADMSDTRRYIARHLTGYSGVHDDADCDRIGQDIGYGNKFCIMNADASFSLVNDFCGAWDGDVWYSNTYSLPGSLAYFLDGPADTSADNADPHGSAYALGSWRLGNDDGDDADDDLARALRSPSLYLNSDTYADDVAPMRHGESILDIGDYYRSLERLENRARVRQ